ncbi:MAG: glycosyltransferase [Planctomycetaceae bacterium]|nr:glycosyltransferase [Planctomycetaceae bacterium]
MGAMSVEISVVVPVYRSAATLPDLLARLKAVLGKMGVTHEIILVEDGSPDNAWDVISELHRQDPDGFIAIRLMRNYGQHNALMCGFRRSTGRYVVTLDDDLQNPPEEIPTLYRAMLDGNFDLIYGSPHDKQHASWRNAGSRLINLFFRTVFRSPVNVTSYRIIRRELVLSTFGYDLNFTFVDGLLAWNTQKIGSVGVEHHTRGVGRSGYSLTKLATLGMNLFTNFSLLPLQVISACGALCACLGFMAAFYYLVQALLSNITVPGYASLMVTLLIVGGVQLLSLGVMGEYLGRLHLNVNRKPQYVERQVFEAGERADTVNRAA